jgi:hypothetical protein
VSKSRQEFCGRITDNRNRKLRERVGRKDWDVILERVEFALQVRFTEQTWTLNQFLVADAREEKRLAASIADDAVVSVFDCTN